MPLAAAVTEQLYLGDGVSTGPYVLSAEIEVATDLVVTIDSVVTTAYTVSGIGNDAGVSVTFDTAPPNGAEIVLARVAPYDRTRYDYQLGNFKPDTVDADVDRVVMQIQQLATALLRVPQLPRGKTSLDLELTPEANKLIGWSADALSLVNLTPATITPAALVFSAIGEAIATAASAAAARAVIGAITDADLYVDRNLLINSSFEVHQRQTASVAPTTAALTWVVDMWQARTSAAPSGTLVAQKVSPGAAGDPASAVRLLRSVGTYAGHLYLEQVLTNVAPSIYPGSSDHSVFDGKVISVQVKARKGSGFTGSGLRVSIVTGTAASQTWTALAGGTWTGIASATVVDVGAGSIAAAPGWSTHSGQFTVPAGTKMLAIRIEARGFTGAGSANDYIDVTEACVEVSPAARIYEKRSFASELRECMRFYEKSWAYANAGPTVDKAGCVSCRPSSTSTTLAAMCAQYSVRKTKFTNLVKFYDPVGGGANGVRDVTAGVTYTVSSKSYESDGQTGIPVLSSSPVANNLYEAHWDVDVLT